MTEETSQRDLRSNIHFAEKDKALREDVHRLGALVGELVREQGGEPLFDLVESARRASIAHREGDEHAIRALTNTLAELTPTTARDFIRAFSTWFQMVNMAEKVHRIRRRRGLPDRLEHAAAVRFHRHAATTQGSRRGSLRRSRPVSAS